MTAGAASNLMLISSWSSDSNGAKSHVKGRSWDRLASEPGPVALGFSRNHLALRSGRSSPWLRLALGIAR